jgi:tetratricopeptide (TPR) repeat protein
MVGVSAGEPAEEAPDWWATQRDVVAILSEGNTDIADLVAQTATSPSKTGADAMRRLNVLMRAGMYAEATEAVSELQSLCPDLDNHQVGQIYYASCDDFLAWELAQRVVEVFADNISQVNLENRLLKHRLESGQSVAEIDRWLADKPEGRDGFWIKQRLRFNNMHGRGERLVQELTETIQQDPQNIARVIIFLDGLNIARRTGKERWDLSWMPETISPPLTTQMEKIASRLQRLAKWETAAVFYSRAIDTPLTDEEVQELALMRQVVMGPEVLRAGFAVHVREGLAKCLLEMGRHDEAQKWMVEAADIREKYGLGLNAFFAGEIQGASGQRVIEKRIEAEAEQREDDPDYWRRRAQYYRGRNEPDQEEHALTTGLALTTPQPRPERTPKGHMDMRRWLLSDYARFLRRMNREPEAVALLRKEIEQAPADTASAEGAANMLAFDLPRHITADDEVLWTWLAHRPKWEHTETRLLWRLLESAPPDDLDPYFARAETLAKQADPTRASELGWIMNRMQHPKRSIPLLEYAVQNADDEKLKERTTFTLFQSYLDVGNWKQAERIFPHARKRLGPGEVPEWFSRIAIVAARAGARDDAMRIWKAAANINPSDLTSLRDLVAAGLRDELIAFYRDMAARLPSSETPSRALKMLGDG